MKAPRFVPIAVLLAASVATVPSAQAVTFQEGAYLVGEFPTEEWAEVAGPGMGIDATNVIRTGERPWGWRSQFGVGYNFGRTVDIPAANAGTALELQTSNFNLWFGIGPEFSKAEGNIIPFVYGTVGLNVNWMDQDITGTVAGQPYDANVGATGSVFAWSAGFGIRKQMKNSPAGRVELSAEYRAGIGSKYVMPDEVTSTGGSVSWDRKEHDVNQVMVRLGTVFVQRARRFDRQASGHLPS